MQDIKLKLLSNTRLRFSIYKNEKEELLRIYKELKANNYKSLKLIALHNFEEQLEKNAINGSSINALLEYINFAKYEDSYITELLDAFNYIYKIDYSKTAFERTIQIGKMKRRMEALNQLENKNNIYDDTTKENHFFIKVIEKNHYNYIFDKGKIYIYRRKTENKEQTKKIFMIIARIENNKFIFETPKRTDIDILNQAKRECFEWG